MKSVKLVAAVCIGIIAFTGCSKKGPPATPPPYDVAGVKVDFPKLTDAFRGAAPELEALVAEASSSVRYGLNAKALESLDKLAATPTLTDPQKQAVNTVIEQMKQVVAKAGASR
jgi:hypothetical protein